MKTTLTTVFGIKRCLLVALWFTSVAGFSEIEKNNFSKSTSKTIEIGLYEVSVENPPSFFTFLSLYSDFSSAGEPSIVSWETHSQKNVFLYHQDDNMVATANRNRITSGSSSWKMVKGLSDSQGVSFLSVDNPGHYLVVQDKRIQLKVTEKNSDFKQNATFYIRKGLADSSKSSFESFSQPGKFIMHNDGGIYLETIVTDQNKADATFSAYTGDIQSKNWQKAENTIWTPWGEQIDDPEQVLQEYPRPQLQRNDNWINLNGLWRCKKGNAGEPVPFGQNLDKDILVPFPVEAALSGVKEHWDRIWYRKVFTVPSDWSGQTVKLHFGAVDWESEIYVNQQRVLLHRGGFDPFSVDITNYLNGGSNELIVRVFDPTNYGSQPVGKQNRDRFNDTEHIFYTPASGIWQTVWLEAVPTSHIDDIKIVPNIDNSTLQLTVTTSGDTSGLTVEAQAKDGQVIVSNVSGGANTPLTISIPNQKLWSPEDPFLYDLSIQLKRGQETIDAVESYFGMRKISLGKHEGVTVMMLNNKFLFQMGPLDQGYWPDGIFTPPSEEAIVFDLQKMKDLGYNMVRKHIKTEPARWYYHADRIGLLVWQDMPNGWNINTAEQRNQHELELERMVRSYWNYPSIIMWVVWNEQWGMYDQVRLTNETMALDPSRMVNGNSACCGGSSQGGHLKDFHFYPAPNSPEPDPNRAIVAGEYGGLVLPKPGHIWDPNYFSTWAYLTKDDNEFTDKFVNYCERITGMREVQKMSAAVYTQWVDVEGEVNGHYTYDRKIFKGDYNRIKASLIQTYDTSVDNGITPPPGYVAWASYNIAGKFIRHRNGESLIDGGVKPKDDIFWKMVPGLAGQGVSFQSKNFPNRYLRHRDGRLFLDDFNDSNLYKEDATFIVKPGLADSKLVSFQSLNFPQHYIRHRDDILFTETITNEIGKKDATFYSYTGSEIVSWESHNMPGFKIRHQNSIGSVDNDIAIKEDAEWKMVHGLAGIGVSFQSVNFPNRYLRHQDNAILLAENNGSALFKEDATFFLREGLDNPDKFSFESYNFPGNYIRHRDFLLYSEPMATNQDRADATFQLTDDNVLNAGLSISKNIQKVISLYPNPLKDRLYIRGVQKSETASIYDITGKKVLQPSFENEQEIQVIDTSFLESGLYFLKIGTTEIKFIKE